MAYPPLTSLREPFRACPAVAREARAIHRGQKRPRPAVALRAMAGQPSLTSLRETFRACPAVAREASEGWWSQAGSNRRPLACHASALPAELWPLKNRAPQFGVRAMTLNHSSGPISSLFVTSDVADDVGNVLIALFLVGNEGRIVVVIVLDGLVDLDIVFRFGNHGLDLAGVLLGIGLLERDQFFCLGGLRHIGGSGSRRGGCSARGIATSGSRRRDRGNRNDLAGIGRNHRALVQVIELFTRRRANTLGSEIGFGHV